MNCINGRSRPVIGVLFPMYWSINYLENFLSVKQIAQELDINILFLQGLYSYNIDAYLHHDSNYDVENVIFDLMSNNLLDGIIVFSTTIFNVRQKKLILNLVKNKFDIPLINVGSQIDGVRNVLVDNMSGMNKLLDHLIRYHHYSRIAFVRGPYGHSDASIRYKLYVDALSEYGIPYDENLVSMPGAWSVDSGEKAAKALLEKNAMNIDVIVCSSDIQARGVVNFLEKQNIYIPDQIAVTGFDNNHFSMCQSSPLTTITLNLDDRCRVALEEMVKIINGADVPENIYIKSSMVLRQSCGCPAPGVRILTEKSEQPDYMYSENIDYEKFHEMLTDEITENLLLSENEQSLKQQIYKYVKRFYTQIENVNESNFIHDCSEIVNETCTLLEDSTVWHRVINIIENKIDTTISENKRKYASHLLLQTRILLGEIGEVCCNVKLLKIEDRNAIVNSLFFNLSKADSFSKIQEILNADLVMLDVHTCYVAIYKNSKQPLYQSLFFHSYQKNQSTQLPPAGKQYKTDDLLAQIVSLQTSPFSLIIEPLFHHNRQLGFVVFDIGPPEHTFYELFPSLLSSAIWRAELKNKGIMEREALDEKTHSLELTNQKLYKKKEQLDINNEQWKNTRGNLIISHKRASIRHFVADITGEFEKNIDAVDCELDKLQQYIELYSARIKDMTQEDQFIENTVQQMQESTGSVRNALETAGVFAQSVKLLTTDYREDACTRFNVAGIINSVLAYLTPCLSEKKIDILVNIDDNNLMIDGSGVNMATVLTNLLMNAITAVNERQNAVIDITVRKTGQDVFMMIRDNGCGIEPDLLSKIFFPLIKKDETVDCSGIGLCIVKDIITGEFGGTINVNSTPGSGSTFTITIPGK